jgi:hypothetical protein
VLRITNELGTGVVETTRPELLLVPAGPGPEAPGPSDSTLDHYACDRIRSIVGSRLVPRGLEAVVTDELTHSSRTLRVLKPRLLCAPVRANGAPVQYAAGHLVCYRSKLARGQVKTARHEVAFVDRFETGSVATMRERQICIASSVEPIAP